uniref:Uncharacterized protein n=1 Tax=Anguilla anguilla TaxID=7936 RepID=A0A0E9VF64_ANGAN
MYSPSVLSLIILPLEAAEQHYFLFLILSAHHSKEHSTFYCAVEAISEYSHLQKNTIATSHPVFTSQSYFNHAKYVKA